MITKSELKEYAKLKRLNLGQSEKEYFQNIVLFIIYERVGREMVFKGGTAMNRCYNLNRFSEDLDFTVEKIKLRNSQETKEVLSALSESDMSDMRQARDRTVAVRWGILHVIDHTSLHLGHMQMTYQLWTGGKAVHSPLWTERLPKNQ